MRGRSWYKTGSGQKGHGAGMQWVSSESVTPEDNS